MKPKRHRPIVYLLACLLIAACEKELELPVNNDRKIVLLGELVAEEGFYIRAGQSTPVKSGRVPGNGLVQNLSIEVKDDAGTKHSLHGQEDDLSSSEFTIPFSSSGIVRANSSFEVRATHPSMGTATANVTVPPSFVATITDTSPATQNGEDCIKITTQFTDGSEKNFYVIEVLQQPFTVEPSFFFNGSWLKTSDHYSTYDSLINAGENIQERMDSFNLRMFTRINCYTDDPAAHQSQNTTSKTLAKRVLMDDRSFNGSTHRASIYIPRSLLGQQFPGIGMRTIVQVKSVSDDYFRFLLAYEQNDPFSAFFSTATPLQIPGNITNGVGMIGGVYRHQFYYLF